VVGGGDVAQATKDVPTDPGGDLGFRRHGSGDSGSALLSPALSEREWNERERLSCSTEQKRGSVWPNRRCFGRSRRTDLASFTTRLPSSLDAPERAEPA
jgi:hypothetical protein